MDTTRKIPDETVLLLDELQSHLKRRGIKTTQKELIDVSVKLAAQHEEAVVVALAKKSDNTKEMTERFLLHAKKFDFGKNWLEEIDTTL